MGKPFKIYRIVCTLTGKALVYGSDCPVVESPGRVGRWHHRGCWGESGAFWKTEQSVRKHIQNLCHDWVRKWAPARWPRYEGQQDTWLEAVPGPPDWSRLQHLRVEQIYISSYATTTLLASDFMGVADEAAA